MLKKKLLLLVSTLFFIFTYDFIWREFCCVFFDYIGYSAPGIHTFEFFCTVLFILAPLLIYREQETLSCFLSLCLYCLAYIPIQQSLYYQHWAYGDTDVIPYLIIMCIAQSCFFMIEDILPRHSEVQQPEQKTLVLVNNDTLKYLSVITVLLLVYCLFIFRNNLTLTSLAKASDARAEQNLVLVNAPWGTGYILTWLPGFFLPLIFLAGVFMKKKLYLFLGIFGFFGTYCCTTMKAELLMPLILLLFFCLFRVHNNKIFLMSMLQGGLSAICLILFYLPGTPFIYSLEALLFERILTCPGYLFSQYILFFRNNPVTYFSHIGIINKLTGNYPYGELSIGQAVHGGNSNSCASFFAMDGIASCHKTGLCIICLIFFFYLFAIRIISEKYLQKKEQLIFFCLLLVPSTIALVNSSFFTYLWTRGVLFILILILSRRIIWTDKTELLQETESHAKR